MKKLLLLLLLLNAVASAQQKIRWPHHKKAAIVLTYDDALSSQLDNAVPQLDSAHLTATFFLTGEINLVTISKWRALSKKGYELGNHTIFHPCYGTDDNPVPSENYTIYAMMHEIYIMNSFLYAVDGKASRTYAYPCTETIVGGKNYVDTLRRSGMIRYARIGGDTASVITNFKDLDPLQVPSYGLNGNNTGTELIDYVKKVQAKGGMGIFMFHGIGGDYITTSTAAHRELLAYLAKNKHEIWVTTFQKAMDLVTKQSKRN